MTMGFLFVGLLLALASHNVTIAIITLAIVQVMQDLKQHWLHRHLCKSDEEWEQE